MKELKFIQLQKDNEEHYNLFKSLMIPYNKELDTHHNRITPNDFILEITRGILNMQGPYDRHLELCYDGNNLIGFFYGKVDHKEHKGFIKPEYGYIMEFYVKPEFRRQSYGKAMFYRLERLFSSHGTKRMYLTADPVTGKPFWTAMGFQETGEFSPENNQAIYEKDIKSIKDIIIIQVSKYLTQDHLDKIALAKWHSDKPEFKNRIRSSIYDDSYDGDCFDVVAINRNDDVVGALYCIQNDEKKDLWYYGDLFVISEYRRQGIATEMIKTAINRLAEIGATILRVYVELENLPSIMLQKSIGFHEKAHETFNMLSNEGQTMFEYEIPSLYNVIKATAADANISFMFYVQNRKKLHGSDIRYREWKEQFAEINSDEQNFIICKGAMPLAWLKINGLQNKDIMWISMLVVSDKHQRQGVGIYAVDFAENYAKNKGFTKIRIHTTEDNIPAQNLYIKCGYVKTAFYEGINTDGNKQITYTFEKSITGKKD